jgi:GST-like protein
MACYPWAMLGARLLAGDNPMPNVERWVAAIAERPATARAYAIAERPEVQTGEVTEADKARLFQQNAGTVTR